VTRLYITFILLPLFCCAQQEIKPRLGVSTGFNISKIYIEGIGLDRSAALNFGINGLLPVNNTFCIKSSVSLSWHGSAWVSPYFKIRNKYVEASLSPAVRFDDEVIFSAGINYASLLNSKLILTDGQKFLGLSAYDIDIFNSEESIDAALELKLKKNVSLTFDYFIPLIEDGTKNFRLAVNVLLLGRKASKARQKPVLRQKAIAQINDLKNGMLLVRLHTAENKIAAMKAAGYPDKAERIQQKQEEENHKIISAFKNNFRFCPVLFFSSENSERINQKSFSGIFLNDALKPDTSLKFDETKKYFVAEFTTMERDTGKYFSHISHDKDSAGNYHEVMNYYGGSDEGFEALVIRDENFNRLERPFPYYVQLFGKSLVKEPELFLIFPPWYFVLANYSYLRAVQIMNDKLQRFYEKHD
jgi:hypothetical protein